MKNKMKFKKKGQITIFIIIGLIIVVLVMLFFLLKNPPQPKEFDESNPQAYIEACTRGVVEEALELLSSQGGDITPVGSITYNSTEITYLCYIDAYYKQCINQRPMLVEHIENEITNYITPKVQNCFKSLELSQNKRYDIENSQDINLVTKLHPKQIIVEIDKEFKMIRENEVREFKHFKMNMVHPIYNFAEIAMEIVNQESRYCNFDVLGFMILYPGYDIKDKITGENDVIYKITERATNQEFWFAVKSCPLPPGF